MKPILRSNTTRAVAAGTAAGAGGVLGLIVWLRSMGLLPWDEGQDEVMAVLLSTVVVPVVSRWTKRLADWLNGRWPRTVFPYVVVAFLSAGLISGCVTTTAPDGTTTRSTDVAATIAVMETTLDLLERGYELYLSAAERADEADRARLEQRAEEQRERMELLRDALMRLYREAAVEVAAG